MERTNQILKLSDGATGEAGHQGRPEREAGLQCCPLVCTENSWKTKLGEDHLEQGKKMFPGAFFFDKKGKTLKDMVKWQWKLGGIV